MRASFLQNFFSFLLIHNTEFLENLIKNDCIRTHETRAEWVNDLYMQFSTVIVIIHIQYCINFCSGESYTVVSSQIFFFFYVCMAAILNNVRLKNNKTKSRLVKSFLVVKFTSVGCRIYMKSQFLVMILMGFMYFLCYGALVYYMSWDSYGKAAIQAFQKNGRHCHWSHVASIQSPNAAIQGGPERMQHLRSIISRKRGDRIKKKLCALLRIKFFSKQDR